MVLENVFRYLQLSWEQRALLEAAERLYWKDMPTMKIDGRTSIETVLAATQLVLAGELAAPGKHSWLRGELHAADAMMSEPTLATAIQTTLRFLPQLNLLPAPASLGLEVWSAKADGTRESAFRFVIPAGGCGLLPHTCLWNLISGALTGGSDWDPVWFCSSEPGDWARLLAATAMSVTCSGTDAQITRHDNDVNESSMHSGSKLLPPNSNDCNASTMSAIGGTLGLIAAVPIGAVAGVLAFFVVFTASKIFRY